MSALRPSLIEFSYLVAVSLFIVGLHYLRTPRTARKGNLCASLGMLLAVLATFIDRDVLSYELLGIGLIVGALVGATVARWVPMTAMPQMVGLLNGFGGGASALVAVGQYLRLMQQAPADWSMATTCTIVLGVLIGGATFSGSMVAFGKLQELIVGRALTFPGQQALQILLLLAFVAGGTYLLLAPNSLTVFLILVGLALLFGGLFVLPIGAADMPVVISLLNSCSGLAASATGFVIRNDLLIIAGALVGASGLILTHMMCKAMNRSLAHVLFGSLGSGGARAGAVGQMEKVTHSIDAEEAA